MKLPSGCLGSVVALILTRNLAMAVQVLSEGPKDGPSEGPSEGP
eukprot:CAMPEP_0170795946 /NCGR_PEP_ID=MMETSP0733-20121128/24490_1 /TAXON_ID=186038 /ORGANISM="Fragilariopsis kerguelensis, Strain L26-C5" /LENGTH=43 /DNA_ID= /DNA_START= /DNA_END= /DNA_ORIENTATION=